MRETGENERNYCSPPFTSFKLMILSGLLNEP
jgi:hypothetical protein